MTVICAPEHGIPEAEGGRGSSPRAALAAVSQRVRHQIGQKHKHREECETHEPDQQGACGGHCLEAVPEQGVLGADDHVGHPVTAEVALNTHTHTHTASVMTATISALAHMQYTER